LSLKLPSKTDAASQREVFEEQAEHCVSLEGAGRAGGLVSVSSRTGRTDERHWGLRIVYYPGAEREFAGDADYHGAWLDCWL
jgi:hypothetical protein